MITQYFDKAYSDRNLSSLGILASKDERPDDGVFRNLLVSWNKLPTKTSYKKDLPCWFIVSDVLRIDSEMIVTQETIIFARRIEVATDAGIIVDTTEDSDFNITIFAQEVINTDTNSTGGLKITRVNKDESIEDYIFSAAADRVSSTGFCWNGSANQKLENFALSSDDASRFMINGEPLRLSQMTLFQYATLISTDEPDLSTAQFRWIASIASYSRETYDLAAQASSFAMNLQATKAAGPNTLLVPVLDLEIYSEDAKAFMNVLYARENYWNQYKMKTDMDKQWAQDAKTQLAIQSNELQLDEKLEEQAENTYHQTVDARDTASKQLSSTLADTVVARYNFEAGVEIWKRKETIDEVFNLITGVAEILMEIPAIVIAGPQLATMPIIKAVGAGLDVAAQGVNAARDIFDSKPAKIVEIEMDDLSKPRPPKPTPASIEAAKKLKEETQEKELEREERLTASLEKAGEGAKKIFDSAKNIAKISATAEAMHESSLEILNNSQDTVNASFSNFNVQGIEVVTGGSQDWDNLDLEITNTFADISALRDIEGGAEYQLILKKMVVAGKTLCMAKLAMAKAASDLATAKLIRDSKQRSVVIIESRLKDINAKVALDDSITQLIFNRVLDAKRAVYMAMESYRRAFQYFTLANASSLPTLPKLTDSYSDFSNTVAQISSKKLQVSELAEYGSLPQTIKEIRYELNSTEEIKSLRDNAIVTFALGANDGNFNGLGRIRFNSVRIFVEGLDPQLQAKIKVDIATSGEYVDKDPRSVVQVKRFVSMQTLKSFIYENKTRKTVVAADVAARYQNDFFKPTPFTTWTIRVGRQDGEHLDLSGVTSLRLAFAGEATPQIARQR